MHAFTQGRSKTVEPLNLLLLNLQESLGLDKYE